MGRLLLISVFVATAITYADAQDASPFTPIPPTMQSAIERASESAVANALTGRAGAEAFLMNRTSNPASSDVCSVPLVEMKVEHPERFTMRTIPAPAVEPMPHAHMPAPPCAQNRPH